MADWKTEGTVLIACSCDWGCPCNFNAKPTKGFCQGGWAWLIEKGTFDGVKLDGLAISLWAKWPGAIHEGGGSAVAFIDDRADEKQRAALTRLLRGEGGGPWGIFINTYELAGPLEAAHRVDGSEYATKLRVGQVVQLELKPMTNPVSGADVHPEMVLPEGLVLKHGALAASSHFHVSHDGIAFDHSGQYTAFGRFEYSGKAA